MASFVVIDVETANAFMGSICQIGLVRFEDGVEVDSQSWLIDPREWFDGLNISIHGIDEAMVRGAPTFAQAHAELDLWLAGAVTVSHSAFDRVAVWQACERWDRAAPDARWLDSTRVCRRAWPDVAKSGYGLKPLAERCGISFRHHDAREDARAAGLVLLQAMADSGIALEDWFKRVTQPIAGIESRRYARSGDGDGPLVGETVCFTGALQMPRSAAADRAAELGGDVTTTVSAKTTLLVVGDQDVSKLVGHSKSGKHRKAEDLIGQGQAIRILSETDFMALRE